MANIITGLRIVCALALIFCPTFSSWFYALYILGGCSDVFDGIAARHSGAETKLGARLDTIADIIFLLIVLLKALPAIRIPAYLIVWIACIAVIKIINIISGFVIFKRFVPEHTPMNRLCGVIIFIIPLCIGALPRQAVLVLIILACVLATIAAVFEGRHIRSGKEIS